MDGIERVPLEKYFMKIAHVVAERSTCFRNNVGAVIVKNKHIVSTGYNGAPRGLDHCLDIGCYRKENNVPSGQKHELCRAVHAEQNAIIQASLNGASTEDGVLFCTHSPCIICAKMIINAKIKKVYYANEYADQSAMDYFKEVGIEVEYLPFAE
ncbi:MAG: cytidine/deoxycytidylate deaminase family protein [DPANN group archaeon]|nr:cytidine/deoxycytidylate deaminase family protein [DPANN group archaeon]